MTIYKMVGLTMKVGKHLKAGNYDKAAMYFAARSYRDGKPTTGSAEAKELAQLKELGYRFRVSPDDDVIAIKPNGRWYSGRDILKEWDDM